MIIKDSRHPVMDSSHCYHQTDGTEAWRTDYVPENWDRARENALLVCVIQRDSAYPAFTNCKLIDNKL